MSASSLRRSGRPPAEELARLVRQTAMRVAESGRAGLAAVPRPVAPPSEDPTPRQAQDLSPPPERESPEERVAQAMKRELAMNEPTLLDGTWATEETEDRAAALERVAAEVAECGRCAELAAERNLTVPGEGNPKARLVFVGEGPGAEEDRQGRPFVGRAGELLTKMIEAIGLTRDEVYICNIVKCRPPGNRNPSADEAGNCRPFLVRQLEVIRPDVIVALGGVAAKNLLDTNEGVGRLRGKMYPLGGARLIVTYHPAYLLRNYTRDARQKVYDDLLAAKAELDRIAREGA